MPGRPLTQGPPEEDRPGAGRLVDAEVVDWRPRHGHADPHQRVDRVAVEGNHDQEDAAYAVDDREKQRQLREKQSWVSNSRASRPGGHTAGEPTNSEKLTGSFEHWF